MAMALLKNNVIKTNKVTNGLKNSAFTRISQQLLRASESDIDSILYQLGTTREGLTDSEARRRLGKYGRNEVAHEKPPTWYALLWRAFRNPFIAVLTVLGIVSYMTGDIRATIVMAVMVIISALLRFMQEFRSNNAAAQLKAMVSTTATVSRRYTVPDTDAHDSEVETSELVTLRKEVPLDSLVEGDIVHLSAGDMIPADVRLLSSKDMFISQSVLTGESLPVEKYDTLGDVVEKSAGMNAEPIQSPLDLSNVCFMGTNVVSGTGTAVVIETGNDTYFGSMARSLVGHRALTSFDRGIASVSWLLIWFMLVMVPVVFLINGLTKGNWVEAFFFGVAVAVGLTPEMLPMIVTANLAKGAVSMARKKSIVKRLNAIQNLGAMNILCTDKTGTLTRDKVILEYHLDIHGVENEDVLEYAYLNSYYQTGLKNLLDVAILEHVELHDTLHVETDYQKIDEIPFDFVRRRMSIIIEKEHNRHLLICKGAVEEVLRICTHADDRGRIVPLSDAMRQRVNAVKHELNEDGLRVVAVAYKQMPPIAGPYSVQDERELVLAGYVAFLDPPRETAGPAIEALQRHGVQVKVLTGDNDIVTRKICKEVGLRVEHVVLGQDTEDLFDEELAELAERTTVFAKLSPLQKARVIRALQSRGHTVGYLGDGINDAAALRDADVGISVDTAVDIAKESADIILLEKSLLVLEEGVVEGRKTFGNIIKYIKMTTSSNFGNVFSVLVASAFLPFLPMLPIQFLILNLLYDVSQTTIPFDEMDEDYLEKPRKWNASDLRRFMVYIGPISSLFDITTFLVLWFIFQANTGAGMSLFQSGWFIESLLSQTLIIHMIRTERIPFIQSRAATPVLLLTGLIMAIGIALPFTLIGSHVGLQGLPLRYFPWLAATLLAYCVLTQTIKVWYLRKFKMWL